MASPQAPAAPAAPSPVEAAKAAAAKHAVAENFKTSFKYVGIGSGTTIVYVVKAIQALGDTTGMQFVPTGFQSRAVITAAGLTPCSFDDLPEGTLMDICFDGADEVDEDLNCIKGGGACLYQEKLVATHARRFVCVADSRKLQRRLLTNWPAIPIEVEPLALRSVTAALLALGCTKPVLRINTAAKTGPIKTDQDFYLIDAQFPQLMLEKDLTDEVKGMGEGGVWEVNRLARAIKSIEGVLSVGIFAGLDGDQLAAQGLAAGGAKPVACYFGMPDGSITIRNAEGVRTLPAA